MISIETNCWGRWFLLALTSLGNYSKKLTIGSALSSYVVRWWGLMVAVGLGLAFVVRWWSRWWHSISLSHSGRTSLGEVVSSGWVLLQGGLLLSCEEVDVARPPRVWGFWGSRLGFTSQWWLGDQQLWMCGMSLTTLWWSWGALLRLAAGCASDSMEHCFKGLVSCWFLSQGVVVWRLVGFSFHCP
jgi:hypothetical protein